MLWPILLPARRPEVFVALSASRRICQRESMGAIKADRGTFCNRLVLRSCLRVNSPESEVLTARLVSILTLIFVIDYLADYIQVWPPFTGRRTSRQTVRESRK